MRLPKQLEMWACVVLFTVLRNNEPQLLDKCTLTAVAQHTALLGLSAGGCSSFGSRSPSEGILEQPSPEI